MMSKDRPIKSFRLESERPFKTYNPGLSMLLADSRRHEQHASDVKQQHLLKRQNHHLSTQLNLHSQQNYNYLEDYFRISSQFLQGYQNTVLSTELSSCEYDAGNHLTVSDLTAPNDSLYHQGDMDMNIPVSHIRVPNFIPPKRRIYRTAASGTLGDMDQISMLEHPMTQFSTSSSVPTSPDNPLVVDYSSSFTGQRSHGSLTPCNNMTTNNGNSPTGETLSYPNNTEKLSVKKEFHHEVGFHMMKESNVSNNLTQRSGSHDSVKYQRDVSISECSMTAASQDIASACRIDRGRINNEKSNGDDSKDSGYLEKRRKNNESAKRSREARRTKEELVALRVVGLEEENMKLRAEICLLDKELGELRERLFPFN